MSFWEDLSPGVKRYAFIGLFLLVTLLGIRRCVTSPSSSEVVPQRGVQR